MDNLRIIAVTNEELVLSVCAMGDEILREYFSSRTDEKQIDEMLEHSFSLDALIKEINNGHEYFLISSDYTFAGFSSVLEKDGVLLLDKLYIHPDFSKKELYLAILEKNIELCKIRNLDKIQLLCDKKNTFALELYKTAGFEVKDEHTTMIGNVIKVENHILEYCIK